MSKRKVNRLEDDLIHCQLQIDEAFRRLDLLQQRATAQPVNAPAPVTNPKQKVAEAFLDATIGKGTQYSAKVYLASVGLALKMNGLVDAGEWLERMAAALVADDNPADAPIPPARGCYGEEYEF